MGAILKLPSGNFCNWLHCCFPSLLSFFLTAFWYGDGSKNSKQFSWRDTWWCRGVLLSLSITFHVILILDLFIWFLLNVMLRSFFFFFFNDLLKAEDLSLVGNLLWDHSCRCGTVLTCLYTFTFMYIESHWQCLLEVVLKQRKQLWSINNNSGLRRMTKLFSLQKTLNVTESNYQPSTTKSTMEPCP